MTSLEHSVLLYSIGVGAAAVTLFALRHHFTAKPAHLPLPPGPKGYPILGNLLDFGYESPWLMYDKWFKEFGDVVHVSMLGMSILLLGSHDATTELLEHRGVVYSDRPQTTMYGKLMECGGLMVLQPYGERWRRARKLFHPHVHVNAVTQYQAVHIAAARTFARNLLSTEPSPDALPALLKADFAETIVKTVYGIDVKSKEERTEYIDNPTIVLDKINEAAIPGRFLVDGLPFLQYIPAWFPGASFQKFAKEGKYLHHKSRELPMEVVRGQMSNGTAPPSIIRSMLEDVSPDDQQAQDIIRDLGAGAFLAGSDTTVVTTLIFFLAMLHFPEAQKAGQAEIRAVLGDRLPSLEDRDSLPYVNAILLETLRWFPAVPGGLAHLTSTDDTYKGYFIPKGTVVLGVIWALLHDPAVYNEPEDFLPDRFLRRAANGTDELDPTVRDPRSAAFGFGRRICPGRHLAEQSLWAMIATILATVDILPAKDEEGKDIIPPISMTTGIIAHPKPFLYRVRLRTPKLTDLLGEDQAQ